MTLGYENAPITLILTVLTVIQSLILGSSEIVSFDINGLYRGELWRIYSSHCIFSNMAQTFIGMLMLYICRHFERQLGSRKYGSFVFLSFVVSVFVQLVITAIASASELNFVPAHGPFFLIFSLLPLFYAYIPRLQSSEFTIFGIGFSEKSWTYLLGAQLGLSQGLNSLLPATVGLAFGYLYLRNMLCLQSFRLPAVVERAFKSVGAFILYMLPLPSGIPQSRARTPGVGTGVNRQFTGAGGPTGASTGFSSWGDERQPLFATDRPPTDEEIAAVTALGFDRAQAIQALRNADNNVEVAVNMLLR